MLCMQYIYMSVIYIYDIYVYKTDAFHYFVFQSRDIFPYTSSSVVSYC